MSLLTIVVFTFAILIISGVLAAPTIIKHIGGLDERDRGNKCTSKFNK